MTERRWLERSGEPRLAYGVWTPSATPRGAVLISHGFAEHAACYRHVQERWVRAGFVVASYDCRGHGESGGVRGYVDHYLDYVRDLEDVLAVLNGDPAWAACPRPILFGHSTGCLATLLVGAKRQSAFSGIGLSSPYFELAVPVSAAKKCFALAVAKVYPTYSENNRLEPAQLTRDPDFARSIANDPLRLHCVTAGWFAQTMMAQRAAFEVAPSLNLPVFCMFGDDDHVVKPNATRRWLDLVRSSDKTHYVVPGGRHEVLNDIGYEQHIALFADHFARWTTAPASVVNRVA
jgi:alpha-beta hydrolase superfamily lysophospholipase